MATSSSILAWRIPGTEEPGGLQSLGSKRVGQDSSKSCLENPMDGGAWWAAVHGVTKSRTRLSFIFTFVSMIILYVITKWEKLQ